MNPTRPGRYLLLISIHGLIRGRDLELGRDADTGGQTKYVVDLARALSVEAGIERVDLVTRRIVDPAVSADYAAPVEPLSERARILRIDAGPAGYIPKEQLWEHLDGFLDNLLGELRQQSRMPDIVHSHYADAGYVGLRLANLLGIPLVHTGHSLGRDKRRRLLASGLGKAAIEQRYNIERRIDAEEETLANAALVVTSTHNEIEAQYGLYDYCDRGTMAVIPPGTDLELFHPSTDGETPRMASEVARFLHDPDKPLILALSRPDERKNIHTLLDAYGGSDALQQAANLLIVAGVREDIRDLEPGPRAVLTELLLAIDAHNLYGRVALPKFHRADEVPQIFRWVARRGGVFVNPALTEPFGLTLLEAAASGLPVVATENGGPVDIIANCRNGELVDPLDPDAIASALLRLLCDRDAWSRASENGLEGVARHYSWAAHCRSYLERLEGLLATQARSPARPVITRARHQDRALFSDLDQNLIGDAPGLGRLVQLLEAERRRVVFGIATGRRIDGALAVLRRHGIPHPDVIISSLGTRIHYGRELVEDEYWARHIDHNWNPKKIVATLAGITGMELQQRTEQTPFKLSWYHDPRLAPPVAEIVALLRQQELTANVIGSFGQFLDIVPSRASKGQALRFAAERLEIPLERVLAVGGSGADEDMIRGNTLAVVVANRHHEELSRLVEAERIYFANKPYALGILEAIEHYGFFADTPRSSAT